MSDTLSRLRAALAGRYEIEGTAGAGGMATVYLAVDLKHRRKVAIKVLRPELATTLGPDRFLREIAVAANLHHPHILPLYDSGEAAGLLYYVMPLVEGESLRERIDREKQLPIDEAVRIALEVVDALGYAHGRGVVHRDIKPENILLESGDALLSDFGIAHAVSAAGGERLTETGVAIGTPVYMSPEQAAAERDIDSRSDLYGLACAVYEMLAGQPPFIGPTTQSLLHQHAVTLPPPVSQFRSTVPPGVTGALARALAKAPADRFNPIGEFAIALTGGGAQGSTPKRPRPRRRRVLLGAVLVLLVLAAILAATRHRWTPQPTVTRSIAVLPFENIGADRSDQYFSDGMSEELITALSKVAGLHVAARTSAFSFQGRRVSARTIGQELGVASLLEGTVRAAATGSASRPG